MGGSGSVEWLHAYGIQAQSEEPQMPSQGFLDSSVCLISGKEVIIKKTSCNAWPKHDHLLTAKQN